VSEPRLLKEMVRRAFANVARPPNGTLHASDEGEEGQLLERDFADKDDWRTVDAGFLDQAPGGFASALSFFTPQALQYFLPAYLIADLDGRLERVDLAYRLSAPFTNAARTTPMNPNRYGTRTRFESGAERFASFTAEQVAAIVAYLQHKLTSAEEDMTPVREALANYWQPRLANRGHDP
jgi:hypothetical protein